MIGFYDYTVILTYLSLMSGTIGIMLCLNGMGHPYLGMFFLLFPDCVIHLMESSQKQKRPHNTDEKIWHPDRFIVRFDSFWYAAGMYRNRNASLYDVYS